MQYCIIEQTPQIMKKKQTSGKQKRKRGLLPTRRTLMSLNLLLLILEKKSMIPNNREICPILATHQSLPPPVSLAYATLCFHKPQSLVDLTSTHTYKQPVKSHGTGAPTTQLWVFVNCTWNRREPHFCIFFCFKWPSLDKTY